jgi:pimeloyl-ACP methyl ester carboxylesterase
MGHRRGPHRPGQPARHPVPASRARPELRHHPALDRAQFHSSFAADVSDDEAAWRTKPSFYLHVTDDHMIPPAAQATMAERIGATVAHTPGSHAIYVSQPKVVADLIRTAATKASLPQRRHLVNQVAHSRALECKMGFVARPSTA